MRNKQQLQALYEKSKDLTLPKYNHGYELLVSGLKEALSENFGYPVAKTLEYDEDNQCFWVRLEKDYTLPKIDTFPRVRQVLNMTVEIDPKLPLLPQFQYIETCIKKLNEVSVHFACRYEESRA